MSTTVLKPFLPRDGGLLSVSITIGAASAQVAVPKAEGMISIRLANSGTDKIAVCFGTAAGAVAILATSMTMLPNSVEVFSIPEHLANQGTLYVAAIGPGAGNTLYITPGVGA